MVQEYVSPVRVHKYPFEMVMAAYERRFPSCPQIPVVIECLITEDSWSSDDSQRHTTRRCQLNVEAPYLLKKMIGVDYIYFIQKNHLDLKNRVLEIEATNETFASRVGVVEKCRYYVHPENSEWTCFEQSALLDVKNFFGLENTAEKIAMKQYAANIAKGKELIESFMKEVYADGVKDLRPWRAQDPHLNRELRRVVSRGTEPLSPRAAAEPQRHSLPESSTQTSCSILSKPSKLKNVVSKSILKYPSPSTSAIEPNSRTSLIDLNKIKKSSNALIRARRHKSDDRLASRSNKSSEKLSQGRSKTELKTKKDLKLRNVSSHPNLRSLGSENSMVSPPQPCVCPDWTRGTMMEVLCRWDGMLAVLVCGVVMMMVLSSPLSFFFGRRRDTR